MVKGWGVGCETGGLFSHPWLGVFLSVILEIVRKSRAMKDFNVCGMGALFFVKNL